MSFAKLFDHSVVRPDATRELVEEFAATAARLQTATLTVQPHYIELGRSLLRGSDVLLGTVVGFPHGNESASTKEYQTNEAMDRGAQEIDMVMNIPALKNGEQGMFIRDIEGVVRAADGAIVKVILENVLLTDEEKRRACIWIADAGAHFVKTSTAYAAGGATIEDVRLMNEAVQGRCLVKAAGGVREMSDVVAFLEAGARRFGSTRTEQFVRAYEAMAERDRDRFARFLPEQIEASSRG